MVTRSRLHSLVVLLAAMAMLAPALPADARSRAPKCRDRSGAVHDLVLRVEGERATGRYALPSVRPRGLVVIAHGFGHTSYSWDRHMRAAARRGLIAVTMDYRDLVWLGDTDGDGLPNSRGWPAIAGARDLIAAARAFGRCRPPTTVLLGWSMGGNMSGLALAIAGEEGLNGRRGGPLFDHWMDVQGAVNFTETYLEAQAAAATLNNETAVRAREDMERETGDCPIQSCPEEYLRRTVPARTLDVRASGVGSAVVIHGVDDGLVPYNQGREMASALRGAGIPTEMITVGLRDEDSERETTLTGHAAGQVDPDYTSPLAGHASERSTTHIVMETALERLWRLVDGEVPDGYRECMANGMVGDPLREVCAP